MNIHHIGYLVKNIEKSRIYFEKLGFKEESKAVYDAKRDVNILFMTNGKYRVELVSPKSENSVVVNTLQKIGNAPYHICYYCNNIENTQALLRKDGYLPIDKISSAVAIDNRKVCFLFNQNIGLIELLE